MKNTFRFFLFATLVYLGVDLWIGVVANLTRVSPPMPAVVASVRDSVGLGRITYYQAVPEQTDSDPFTSSCGPNRPNQVAVSRDLMGSVVECGSIVQVYSDTHGYIGEFVVWDVTNARFAQTLDILTEIPYDWGKTAGHMVVIKGGSL